MDYPMEPQELGLWCWAAVSLSVEKYFNAATQFTQCAIATAVKQSNCCANKLSCNQADELQVALDRVGHFRQMLTGRLSFQDLRDSIRAGFPVCARIGWIPSGGHFVVITGYTVSNSGVPYVAIADPLYESRTWSYDDFSFAYFGIGSWTHTYLVRR